MGPIRRPTRPVPAASRASRGACGLLGVALLSAGSAGCAPARGEAALPLQIDVRARALTPGEPVRIDVRSPQPLVSLDCRFLDAPVFMMSADDGHRWSGWGMIALDQEPTAAAVEAQGATTGGREALGSRAVSLGAKEFPLEELSVASKYVTPSPEVQERLAEERAALAEVYRMRRSVAPPTEPFVRPVPGVQTSVFGTRRMFNGEPRSPHPGVDLRGDTGTPVRAAGPGMVAMARDLYYSGNTVILDHGGGLFTLYAHLSRIDVEAGQRVAAGDLVGLVGATGRVTGPHLHWGAKIGNRPFDPAALLDPALFD